MPTPAYLKAFKTFLASGAGLEDRPEIEQELNAEDRGSVILGAANVEDILQFLIEQKMRRPLSNDLREHLFEGTGPLSSFSARINIGYALGLFGPKFRHDLDLIRELRNGFAHVRHPMTLSTPQVAEVVKHLQLPDDPAWRSTSPGVRAQIPDWQEKLGDAYPRTRYVVAWYTIYTHLLKRALHLLKNTDYPLP